MANERRQRNMRQNPTYRTNGAAAYDVNYTDYQYGTAAPARKPAQKPRKKPAHRKQAKARMTIAPMAVAGVMLAGIMLLLVVCGYVQLYEATAQVSLLEDEIVILQEKNERLQSAYDEAIDLTAVEAAATELGMHIPNSHQTVYLNLSGRDKAEILTVEETGIVGSFFEAISSAGHSLVDFFQRSAW